MSGFFASQTDYLVAEAIRKERARISEALSYGALDTDGGPWIAWTSLDEVLAIVNDEPAGPMPPQVQQ